jgi:hypothetical protein
MAQYKPCIEAILSTPTPSTNEQANAQQMSIQEARQSELMQIQMGGGMSRTGYGDEADMVPTKSIHISQINSH